MDNRSNESYGSQISDRAEQLSQQAMDQFEHFREQANEISERAVAFIRERPGTSLLLAAGLGYLIGRIARS